MRFYRPDVVVPGDIPPPVHDHSIMGRMGELIGYDPEQDVCLWRFGFIANSTLAVWSGVCVTDGFLWVLSDRTGEEQSRFTGWAFNLPLEFDHVITVGEPVEEDEEGDTYGY